MSFIKKLLIKKNLVLFISIIPFSTLAQTGYFDNNPIWQIQSSCAVPYPCIETKDYNYYINGDTVFNNHIYKKLFIKGSGQFMWLGSPVPPNCQGLYIFHDTINIYAFVRDTLNKIYLVSSKNLDTLLYDFNLSIGDTIPFTYNNANNDITVVLIDSIAVSNFYRKRFHLSANSQSRYLIEGIGHDGGFIEPFPIVFDCGYNLICFGLGDTSYYPTIGNTCNINVGLTIPFNFLKSVSIFPNPTYSQLNIQSSIPIFSVIVYNFISQPIIFANGYKNKNLKVDLSSLDEGLYFIETKTVFPSHSFFIKFVKLDSK